MRICQWKNSDCIIFNDVVKSAKSASRFRTEVELSGYEVKTVTGSIVFAPINEVRNVRYVNFTVPSNDLWELWRSIKQLFSCLKDAQNYLYNRASIEEIAGYYLSYYKSNPLSTFESENAKFTHLTKEHKVEIQHLIIGAIA